MIKKFLTSKFIERGSFSGFFSLIYKAVKDFFKHLPQIFDLLSKLPWYVQECLLLIIIMTIMPLAFKLIDFISIKWQELKEKLTTGKFKL